MQGIIFNALEEYVLEKAGMELWNSVIDDSKVASGGIYTARGKYDDAEIIALTTTLSEKLALSLNDCLNIFGEFLFNYLVDRGPIKVKDYTNLQSLLSELESVIYGGVKLINPDTYTPLLEYIPRDENSGELVYRSNRQLCPIAEGVIKGLAKHYYPSIIFSHTQCMHDDYESCKWNLIFTRVIV
ncbi:MAG: hypothetical protein ACJA0E_000605 [Bermanella sp.]|jgi:hypothetical protein